MIIVLCLIEDKVNLVDYVEKLCSRFNFFYGNLFFFYDIVINFLVNCFFFLIFGKEFKLDDCEVEMFVEVVCVFWDLFDVVNMINIFLMLKYIFFDIIRKVKCVGEIWDEIFERKFGEYILIF